MEKEKFDYSEAIKELEQIAAKAEDASAGIDEMDRYIKRAEELVSACRAYLKGARETLNGIE